MEQNNFIASGSGAWFSPEGNFILLDRSHEQFVNDNRELFDIPPEFSGDDLIAFAIKKGWVRIRGNGSDVTMEAYYETQCLINLSKAAKYLCVELCQDPGSLTYVFMHIPNIVRHIYIRTTLGGLITMNIQI